MTIDTRARGEYTYTSKAVNMKNRTRPPDSVTFAKVLADPTRQQIMECCCCEWRSVTQIVGTVKVSQPTVSHHLAVLRAAGLVESKDKGKNTYYLLNQDRVAVCCGRLIASFAPESKAAENLIKLNSIG